MQKLTVDPTSHRLRIRTYAEGMFSALAHDLELEAREVGVEASVDGDTFELRLTVPVESIRVVGVLKRGVVDPSVLKAGDKADIEQKIRREILDAASVTVEAAGSLPAGKAKRDVRVKLGAREATLSAEVGVEARDDRYEVRGRAEVALSRLGIKPVKGPLGAFRLKDVVEVLCDLTLRREEPSP